MSPPNVDDNHVCNERVGPTMANGRVADPRQWYPAWRCVRRTSITTAMTTTATMAHSPPMTDTSTIVGAASDKSTSYRYHRHDCHGARLARHPDTWPRLLPYHHATPPISPPCYWVRANCLARRSPPLSDERQPIQVRPTTLLTLRSTANIFLHSVYCNWFCAMSQLVCCRHSYQLHCI